MKPSEIQVGKTYLKAGRCGPPFRIVEKMETVFGRGEVLVHYRSTLGRPSGTCSLPTFAAWAGSEVNTPEPTRLKNSFELDAQKP